MLSAEVIEAKNLEAKDANGFSDPYCMLGIIPGDKAKLLEVGNNFMPIPFEEEQPISMLTSSERPSIAQQQHAALNKTQTTPQIQLNTRHSLKGESSQTSSSGQQQQQQQQHSTKTSLIKRFSSFRKSERPPAVSNAPASPSLQSATSLSSSPGGSSPIKAKSNSLGAHQIRIGVLRDKLPAKYIKTTDVKKATLNPVWMEKFTL
jgi:hypothetical protein